VAFVVVKDDNLSNNMTRLNNYIGLVLIQVSYFTLFLRGSLGFGEEALQSLPGNVGSQVLSCFYI
jgi:hypothetical protein